MLRRIIHMDEEACTGCGLCAEACHEGAIGMVNGKAKLLREDYCDGLGDCLSACPAGAIRFELREAPAYDAAAVRPAKTEKRKIRPDRTASQASCLTHWPVQLKLSPVRSPDFSGAEVLIAADCTAYAYGNFHRDFMSGRITLVGCPKLDGVDYSEKLAAILAENDIQSVTVARMEVPCCGGLEAAVRSALEKSGKDLPLQAAVLSTEGRIL